MTVSPTTLRLTRRSALTAAVDLVDQAGNAEDLADATIATLEIRDGAQEDSEVLASVETSEFDDGSALFTIAETTLSNVDPGTYWGFVRITIDGDELSLYEPFPVEVAPS